MISSRFRFRDALPRSTGIVALAALASLATAPPPPELALQANTNYCVEIDGSYAPDARCFTTKDRGKFLVDIPSLSMTALIDVKTKKAVSIASSSIEREAGDSRVRLSDPVPADAPAYEVSTEGEALRFQVDKSEVRVQKASNCWPVVMPGLKAGPITDDPSARACVHMQEKPITPTAGCSKEASVKNTCDRPVLAVIHSIQRLTSGSLPEDSSVLIPPGGEYPLGCAWSSGAMAPTVHEVRAAQFLPKKTQ
jgi:hypothetical protein